MKTQIFQYFDLKVRYAVRQGRKPVLPMLLFNGIGQSLEVFEPLVRALPGITIITLDVPGAGLSDVPSRPMRYKDHARVANALLEHLSVKRVNVFGVSWGGGLAQQFAHQYSAKVDRLILAAAPPGSVMLPGNPKVYLRMVNVRRFLEDDYMHSIAGDIYGGDVRTDMSAVDQLVSVLKPPTRKGYIFQAMAMYGWSSLPFLCRLQSPTLLLQGEDDPMIPNVNARLMAKLIPDSRLEFLDCGHLFLLTRLERISPLIREFAYG